MWQHTTPGIPDDWFTRGNIPMTKQEVRVVALAKARIEQNSVVYDIGAGTGSLSVEAALLAPKGKVYAIEREAEGVELVRVNSARFGAGNVQVIKGQAPEALHGLPQAGIILIGGSGGRLAEIIQQSFTALTPQGRLVINAVTLETVGVAHRVMEECGFKELEIVSLAVTRWPKVGNSHMAKTLNPVFIISGTKE